MNVRRTILLTVPLAVALAGYAAASQNSPAPKSRDSDKEPEFVDIQYGELLHNDITGRGAAKHITVKAADTIVKGDEGSWDQKARTAEASGHLTMTDPKADATGKKVVIYYAKSKKLMVITNGVEITIKPKKEDQTPSKGQPEVRPASLQEKKEGAADDEESPRKYPALVTCDKLEYEYAKDKKHGVLTGHFKVVQKLKDNTRTVTADHAEWFGRDEKIVLYPPVHWEDTKGNSGDNEGQVTINTADSSDEISTGSPGSLRFKVEDNEEKPEDKPAAKPAKGAGKG